MPSDLVLVDNDVLLKISAYDAPVEIFFVFSRGCHQIGALKVAEYVVKDLIKRRNRVVKKERALAALEALSDVIQWLEPETDEIALAATYEEAAQRENLGLDTGESLLLAMLVLRWAKLLLTGDKRAIISIEHIASLIGVDIAGRVGCFEQLILSILPHVNAGNFRSQIREEEDVDKAMSISFACKSEDFSADDIRTALSSYVGDLRRKAANVLVTSDDLSAIIP
jgi:hypothetical protein